MKTQSICIMGTPVSSGNRGVLALGASLTALIKQVAPACEITLLLNHRCIEKVELRINGEYLSIPIVNCRLSPRSQLREHLLWIVFAAIVYRVLPFQTVRAALANSTPWIRAVADATIVGDIRGGDSFSDIYGLRRFLLAFLHSWAVILVKGDMVHFPQTYGPFKSPVAKRLAKYLLQHSSVVLARDVTSQDVAQKLTGGYRDVVLSPDVAFALDAIPPANLMAEPPGGPTSVAPNTIGLNVNGLMFNGGYTRANMFDLKLDYPQFLHDVVVALMDRHPGELILIPHTYEPPGNVESDNEACFRLRSALPVDLQSRVRIVAAEYDAHELKSIIGQCAFFLGARMHSCIAALSQGVPCIGVSYSRKFQGVFDSVEMGEWVLDCRALSNEDAVSRSVQLYERRGEVWQILKKQSYDARERLDRVFRQLVSDTIAGPAKIAVDRTLDADSADVAPTPVG